MSQTIKLKTSAIPSSVPTVGDLVLGEVAVNTYDGKLYFKKDDGSEAIVELDPNSSTANKSFKTNIAFGSGATVVLVSSGEISSGDDVVKVTVRVNTAFDGAPTFTIGTASTTTSSVVGDVFDLTDDTNPQVLHDFFTMTANEAVNGYFTAGGATVGSMDVLVERVIQ